MTLKRMDPPRRSGGRKDVDGLREWTLLLEPLMTKANTGLWFLVREYESNGAANTCAYEIRKGRKSGVPAGEWEASARDGAVYVRYMGGGQ